MLHFNHFVHGKQYEREKRWGAPHGPQQPRTMPEGEGSGGFLLFNKAYFQKYTSYV